MTKHNLTKKFVEELPYEAKSQKFYWDKNLIGFGLRIGATKKAYIIQHNIKGKAVRITIGNHKIYTAEVARGIALQLIAEMAQGINPNEKQKQEKLKSITLDEIHQKYLEERKHHITSNTTRQNYSICINKHLPEWKNKSLKDITSTMITQKHARLTESSSSNNANAVMKYLGSLFSYASYDDETLRNPVTILTHKKLWHRKAIRETYIDSIDLSNWYAAVMNLQNDNIRDALRMILLTGARKNEVYKLRWQNIDFRNKTFRFPVTKNKKALILPIAPFLESMLSNRYENRGSSEYVFKGKGINGNLVDAKKSVIEVIEQSGVQFIIHDLRRTFITKAESLDLSYYVLKSLVNHTISGNDVTDRYIIKNPERLREPMEKIEGAFLKDIHIGNRR